MCSTVAASGWPLLVCQDAWRRLPFADVLYGCDAKWWDAHKGTDFKGEKWSSHSKQSCSDDKLEVAEKYNINLVKGAPGDGYSIDPTTIHYGDNSGHQAVNLAILLGATYIVLVGFDMRRVDGEAHFFGDHPKPLHQRPDYNAFLRKFRPAPEGVTIINATPGSALTVYPHETLRKAIENYRLHRDGSESNAVTGQLSASEGV